MVLSADTPILWISTAKSPNQMRDVLLPYAEHVKRAADGVTRREIVTQLPLTMFLHMYPTEASKRVLKALLHRISPSLTHSRATTGWNGSTLKAASQAVDLATMVSMNFEFNECTRVSDFLKERERARKEV
mmetsp:Transcript_67878/g.113761  ORF Transcript_67878/g.113761 Transcript_67878/m.113761 type:complete len:131 (-) Transcript_67878:696-1088(-)